MLTDRVAAPICTLTRLRLDEIGLGAMHDQKEKQEKEQG